jgi:hypothetical protein
MVDIITNKEGKLNKVGIAFILLIIFLVMGVAIAQINNSVSYVDQINVSFDSNSSYIWYPSFDGIIDSLSVSGYLEGESVSVEIIDERFYDFGLISYNASEVGECSGEINVSFDYGDVYGYDTNNDGITLVDGVIDFSISSSFDFEVNQSYLCAKYVVNNLDLNTTYPVCYGSLSCCDFLNLESKNSNWSSNLFLNKGKYSSGYNNTVLTTLVYYDVSLNESDLHSNIYNSKTMGLNANFVNRVYFYEEGVEGINFDDDFYNISVMVDGVLYISNITYNLLADVDESLDVYSYPVVNSSWVIEFNVSGIDDLVIAMVNGSYDDVSLVNITCGDLDVNASIVLSDGSDIPYEVYMKLKRLEEIEMWLKKQGVLNE